jgi:putative molybdopterin biosynthesis protein
MKDLLSTREVAGLLGINEKMVYTLVSEKGLPATKVTGKWLFPKHLVEQWIESKTINYPDSTGKQHAEPGLLVLAGSNDLLLEKTLSLFNTRYPDQLAVFGNLGSLGGLRALRRNQCHIASSHLLHDNEKEYNFDFAASELSNAPAMVNFCLRQQGLLIQKENPKHIDAVSDLAKEGLRVINRPLGTGTRQLFDRELSRAGISGDSLDGYEKEVHRHLDIGLEVLSGRADVGPGIQAVAGLLGIDFIPLRWERYDLMISKDRFFDEGIQRFVSLLHDKSFKHIADKYSGYDLKYTGKMIFPGNGAMGKPESEQEKGEQ